MRTSRAKTVPPGPAMGPNMVLAARKTERVVRERVRRFASAPLAGMRNQDPNNYSDANRGCLVPGRAEAAAEPCSTQTLEAAIEATRGLVIRRGRTRIGGNGRVLKFWVVVVHLVHLARVGIAVWHIVRWTCPGKI